jgi:hypothetical protein|tara:strand:+ start:7459 stop:8247 length:789 start_codon:yes stop_codon:yes gene_type:complete
MSTKKYTEDAPTNATGSAVVGTGDDPVTWKKKKKKKILRRLKGTYEVGRMPDPELTIEGKNMDWFHKLIKQGKSAEQISRIMELDRDTVEALMERNYRKEYDNYHAQPEQRVRNAARLRARRLMVKKGKAEKHDKLDVHHKDNNPLNNDTKNLSVVTQRYNRKEPRLRKEDGDAPVSTPTIDVTPDSTFATMPVFKVSSDDFSKCQDVKKKYERWSKHIDTESEYGKKIHTYAKKNPKKSIIVQDDKSGHMVYLKKYLQSEK